MKKIEPNLSGQKNYLFVLPWSLDLVGGVNTVVINLYNQYIYGKMFRPMVLINSWDHRTMTRKSESGRETVYFRLRELPRPHHGQGKALAAFLLHWPATLWKLYRMLIHHRISVVNPHFPGTSLIHFVILKCFFRMKFKLIVSMHGSDVTALENSAHHASLAERLLLCADTITVPSRSLSDRLISVCPQLQNLIQPIYNGVDWKNFCDVELSKGCSMRKLEKKTFVLSLGLNKVKGVEVLLRAFRQIHAQYPELHLVLAGQKSSYALQIQQAAIELGLDERTIILTGVGHDDIPSIMRKAEFIVIPSLQEGGVPLALLEAAAARRAVVASNVGGIPELVTDGENGLLVPPESASELGSAMLRLIQDEDLKHMLAQNLFESVRNRFSWEQTAKQYATFASPQNLM